MDRAKILWFGRPASKEDRQSAEDHELVLIAPAYGDDPDFQLARAAIFWATGTHFGSGADCLKRHVAAALNEGIYVVVVVSAEIGDVRLTEVNKILKDNDHHGALAAFYRVRSEPVSIHKLMNQALVHDPGPAKNLKLEIECHDALSAADTLLLRRAFHDCKTVRLKTIAAGFSGAKTFIVEATLSASNAGPEPEPFFAKLGDSGKLQTEMERFKQFAEHHVPWYLRPNFLRERSIYGVTEGILVGSFVRGSLSLGECARTPAGPGHIRSLFEETLAGLRRQGHVADVDASKSVVDALAHLCNHSEVPGPRCVAAAKEFGGDMHGPDNLWWRMLSLPPQPWRSSGIHGDMHGENVRVRKQDAIVIDFAQACVGPAAADLANLEVWLAFTPSIGDPVGKAWKAIVDELYSPKAIDTSLAIGASLAGPSWIYPCVAEIRRLARSAIESNQEYKRILAVYLLRQASFPASPEFPAEDEFRRTYAYWLSCELVASLENDVGPGPETI